MFGILLGLLIVITMAGVLMIRKETLNGIVPPAALYILLALLQVLDVHSTWVAVSQYGPVVENNPIAKTLFGILGFWPTVIVQKPIMLVSSYALCRLLAHPWPLWSLNAMYIIATGWNYWQLYAN
ncbi:MAG: hypothetical protein A3I44_04265 [Candidatus Sungbacteria bacterium RIFCSPLOWO2_02_FULL_51_17]|uniref:DUF5658 domain-containing protein n=1 Tax=Candidatus Sungbacteria bacterium RIFCSPHIGHO2_02_FULL_51_29 TaxID=1802273 RepID=A0A1G2KW68_9BACT|nr:MAG: hypothetical protein A2676_02775 [Candidatus Sungbacteria bacterium RIFCSPHIGHO2_01_FULL_51_22]OHA03687.1 MAG: hypothetical protein A3C16_03565 [Candidatus Sungbacteria bacterium RIFCSPHIGHO2_02_FULL_51_29]OHA07329.1 MAG: hypothetical protein A3B29_02870 [Candidatus Sungbacteria bacterium RIFCSPLOWO2_01_FULL_51_34]OHA11292.1 MAG: hypothetical protein A3I44_04265 [Candidatus Sungbacteria bacterium RIFCSPLOWO2_02_FULL_51_17]